jgi:hypothetical protein
VVSKARGRYDLPVTHVVVDLELESAGAPGGSPKAPRSAPEAPKSLRVYHVSDYDGALAIRESGFRDVAEGAGAGVWVTDRPPDAGDDVVLFAVDIPESAAAAYERDGDDGRRRFLLPAELLNRQGPPVVEGDWSE